jgi:hypothetical protein
MAATIGSEMIGAPIYGQISPERVIGADRRERMRGSLLNRSRSVSAMRDLPTPGSPEIKTTCPSPPLTCSHEGGETLERLRPLVPDLVVTQVEVVLSSSLEHFLHAADPTDQVVVHRIIGNLVSIIGDTNGRGDSPN